MSAPFFALDRIARTWRAPGGDSADTLAAIELPLPALTISGAGVVLPDADGVTPKVGALHITVLGDKDLRRPHAARKLTAERRRRSTSARAAIPAQQVKLEELARRSCKALIGGDTTQTITLLAPHAMPRG